LENGNYFRLMERMGKTFCEESNALKVISMGEKLFVAAMANFTDRELRDRGSIQTFLRKNPEVREALEKAKDIFGFFRICINMVGQNKVAWYTA